MTLMKKGKKLAMEFSPPRSFFPVSEQAKARFRYQSLLQDYEELIKENESKQMQLQKAIQKKLKLLAEVKFLRRKYTYLVKNPSGKIQYRLKRRLQDIPFQLIHNGRSSNLAILNAVPITEAISIATEDVVPSRSTIIDLNQNAEEMEELQVTWEPLKIDKLKYSMKGDVAANDQKLSICGDAGNGVNQVGKRKIKWQDQLALRV